MSPIKFRIGDTLSGNGIEKIDSEIEASLEARRPPNIPRRHDSIFMRQSTDFSTCGIKSPGFIYRVNPQGHTLRYDLKWIGEMQKAQLKGKHANIQVGFSHYPDWSDSLIEECCREYWSGNGTSLPDWEFLAASCEIAEIISDELVSPSLTKGGMIFSARPNDGP
jgi:hypothetical protein